MKKAVQTLPPFTRKKLKIEAFCLHVSGLFRTCSVKCKTPMSVM